MSILGFGKNEELENLKKELAKTREELFATRTDRDKIRGERDKIKEGYQALHLNTSALISKIKLLSQTTHPEQVMTLFWETLTGNLEVIRGLLLGISPDGKLLTVIRETPPEGTPFLKQSLPNDGDSLASWAFQKGAPVFPEGIAQDTTLDVIQSRGLLREYKICVPVKVEGEGQFVIVVGAFKSKEGDPALRHNLLNFLGTLFGLALGNARRLEKIEAENRRKMGELAKYHSQEAMERILAGDATRQGELRKLTVMFIDIRGFTSLSEKLSPAQVVELLNLYLEDLTAIITSFGGAIDKFVGDEIMALFGIKESLGETALFRAMDAGLRMVEHHQILDSKLSLKKLPLIQYGIGIHQGEAIVGNVGSEQRRDFTAIGDTVNIGARLCSESPGRGLLTSESTARKLHPYFTMKVHGEVQLKGKSAPMRILGVLGVSDKFTRCPNCADFLKPEAKFCGTCGQSG